MVDQVEQNTGSKPECLLADAGYRGEAEFSGIGATQDRRRLWHCGEKARRSGKRRRKNNTVAEAASERMAKRLEAAARQATIRAPQRDGGAGVRMGERGVRIPAIFAAGSQESTRRMEFGHDGVESAADGEDGGVRDGGLSGGKREKKPPREAAIESLRRCCCRNEGSHPDRNHTRAGGPRKSNPAPHYLRTGFLWDRLLGLTAGNCGLPCTPLFGRLKFSRAIAGDQSETRKTARKASWGISTFPTRFMRFFPSFCLSRSLRLRVISPP